MKLKSFGISFLMIGFLFFPLTPRPGFAQNQKIEEVSAEPIESIINLEGFRPAGQIIEKNGVIKIQENRLIRSSLESIRRQLPIKGVVVIDPEGNIFREAKGNQFVKMPQTFPKKSDGGHVLKEVLKSVGASSSGAISPKGNLSSVGSIASAASGAAHGAHSSGHSHHR